MVNIRIAEPKDLEVIVRIYNQAVTAGQRTADTEPVSVESRRKWFESHDPAKYPIIVAESEGDILGWASVSAYRPGRKALRYTAEISYYIDFDYHYKGIGSLLLLKVIEMCPLLHIKTLFAILIDSNLGSINLLRKFNFEEWGHMPAVADFDGIEVGHLYYGLRIK